MSNLTNSKLRRMIMQELAKMVGEDALVAPGGQETIIPMQVFACEKCGHVNKEFADVEGMH